MSTLKVRIYQSKNKPEKYVCVKREDLIKHCGIEKMRLISQKSKQHGVMVYLCDEDHYILPEKILVVKRKIYPRCPIYSYDPFSLDNVSNIRFKVKFSQKFGKHKIEWLSPIINEYEDALDLFNEVCKSPHFVDGEILERINSIWIKRV